MADSVSFKVVLKEENELRRFVVDKEVSTSFSYLQEKLCLVFPQLKQKIFSITWIDEDGDMVTISTDEELIIALTEMAGPVYKLTVIIKSEKKTEDNSSDATQVHLGVVCDACEKTPITGHRYKCVVCDDFDLCGSCEAAGRHPGHNMIRISNPEMVFPQRLFKRIHKMQERAEKRNSHQEKNGEPSATRNSGNVPPPPFIHPRGRHGFRGFPGMRGACGGRGGMRGGCGAGAWAGPAFEAMMKGWMGEQETGNKENKDNTTGASKKRNDQQREESKTDNISKEATTPDQEAINEAIKQFATMAGSAECLKNVGNFVAAALDPFGIDVQVHVETPEGGSNDEKSESSSPSTSDDKTEEKESTDELKTKASATSTEDWTIVGEKDVETNNANLLESRPSTSTTTTNSTPPTTTTSTPSTTTASTSSTANAVDQSSSSTETLTSSSAPPAAVTHPDPKIQVAVQAMMNMGFTNEGGWLGSLLEAKNGDIGKVLDILQPIRN